MLDSRKNLGMALLANSLIVNGLRSLFELSFIDIDTVSSILALAAGILLLLGR